MLTKHGRGGRQDLSLVTVAILVTGTLIVCPLHAAGDIIGDRVVTVVANDSTGTLEGRLEILMDTDVLVWTSPHAGGTELMDKGGTVLGYVKELECRVIADPAVILNFVVIAGETDTDFTLTVPSVDAGGLTDPDAYASAGMDVTGDGDGATATGLHTGTKAYQARYNGSTAFANLIDQITFSVPDTQGKSGREPAAGWSTISDTVNSIDAQFKFRLSALDFAVGTSRFEVVPEPATLGFLGLGLAVMLLRRRTR
jgi:hypothetical protein